MRHRAVMSLLIALALCATRDTHADEKAAVEAALKRAILAPRQTLAEVQDFCENRVPRIPPIATAEQWRKQVDQYRSEMASKVVFRGEAANWRAQPTNITWLDEIEGGPEYRIKKLLYEAVPGIWVPALLYVPNNMAPKVPVVLNVNGHEAVGKSADYKQIRCINLAKRGMLALNVEWFGMGQFRTEGFRHDLINTIDLCGTSGIATHMLALQRGLDVLLQHPNADPTRVAVAGLSGGGWQTIFLSGFDPRVTLSNPVAGYSSFLTRLRNFSDLGDHEQTPCDLAVVLDYTHLTAMMAPKPTLLTFNKSDNCCFASDHALPPLVEASAPIFKLFGAESKLRSHVNSDPGDHNFGLDNRKAFYAMIADHFYPGDTAFARDELPCENELKSNEALIVPLPKDSLDFGSLARKLAENLPHNPAIPTDPAELEAWRAAGRLRLRGIVRPFDPHTQATEVSRETTDGLTIVHWKLTVGAAWNVPAVEFARGNPKENAILIGDKGKADLTNQVLNNINAGRRVVVLDPFYFGECKTNDHDYLFALMVSTVGERPLGVQAGQVMACARWLSGRTGDTRIDIESDGPRTSIIALVAAALEPALSGDRMLAEPLGSLKSLVQNSAAYTESPELFCFGLLEAFDVPQLEALSGPPRR